MPQTTIDDYLEAEGTNVPDEEMGEVSIDVHYNGKIERVSVIAGKTWRLVHARACEKFKIHSTLCHLEADNERINLLSNVGVAVPPEVHLVRTAVQSEKKKKEKKQFTLRTPKKQVSPKAVPKTVSFPEQKGLEKEEEPWMEEETEETEEGEEGETEDSEAPDSNSAIERDDRRREREGTPAPERVVMETSSVSVAPGSCINVDGLDTHSDDGRTASAATSKKQTCSKCQKPRSFLFFKKNNSVCNPCAATETNAAVALPIAGPQPPQGSPLASVGPQPRPADTPTRPPSDTSAQLQLRLYAKMMEQLMAESVKEQQQLLAVEAARQNANASSEHLRKQLKKLKDTLAEVTSTMAQYGRDTTTVREEAAAEATAIRKVKFQDKMLTRRQSLQRTFVLGFAGTIFILLCAVILGRNTQPAMPT